MSDERSESVFMQHFITFNRYKVCVEVGVWKGGTTQYLCNAAKATGGHVHGFDAWADHGLKKQFRGTPSISQATVEADLRSKGHSNFTLNTIDSTSEAFKTLITQQCPVVDFAFIDGCHSYPGLKNDFDVVYPLLSPTGTIAFHDTLRIDGCREFMLDLRTKYFDGSYDIIDLPWGLGDRRAGLSLLIKRQFPVVNLPLDEVCGSPSSASQILEQESKWLQAELKKHIPTQVDASSIVVDTSKLGKIPKK